MPASVVNLLSGNGMDWKDTPYGRVATVESQPAFEIAWIYKDQEPIEPSLLTMDVPDFIIVLQGGLMLELRGDEPRDDVLKPGDAVLIPAGVPFRGYRYPRNQVQPTIFIAIYRQGAVFSRAE